MSRDYFRDRLGRFAARPDGTAKAIQIVIALWHVAGWLHELRGDGQ